MVDFQLPGTDGLKAAEFFRHLPGAQRLPLVLLSATRLRAGDTRAAAVGISVFVYKPIRRHQLREALTRALEADREVKKAPAVSEIDSSFAQRLPLRILLTDDNPVNLKVGQAYLQKMGYRPDLANNGLEAVQAVERQPFDLIFLDVQMPEMDGLEAAREICRRWGPDERPRLVAMTASALAGDKEKCLAAGMDDYVSKPVRLPELQAVLLRWGQPRAPVAAPPTLEGGPSTASP
jgi:CheY-like chemotaxis protein